MLLWATGGAERLLPNLGKRFHHFQEINKLCFPQL